MGLVEWFRDPEVRRQRRQIVSLQVELEEVQELLERLDDRLMEMETSQARLSSRVDGVADRVKKQAEASNIDKAVTQALREGTPRRGVV
jgi:predicted  nucleic acid-binding Zn-ribbon protein